MSEEWQYASIVSKIGKWAWIIGLINGIFNIIAGIVGIGGYLYWSSIIPLYTYFSFYDIWSIVGGIILIAVSLIIIRPKFSNKCAEMDWDALYEWYLPLGSFKLPWMLIWGILFELFGWYGWGGLAILLPAVFLLFMGPKEFNWSTEESKPKKKPKPKPKPKPKTEPKEESEPESEPKA